MSRYGAVYSRRIAFYCRVLPFCPPLREQLCNRSRSNKTHTPLFTSEIGCDSPRCGVRYKYVITSL
jgi:hypothetical protein